MIDDSMVIEALRGMVRSNPDFQYLAPRDETTCLYWHQGSPSCGVGVLLDSLGIQVNDLDDIGDAWKSIRRRMPGVSQDILDLLWSFQTYQDRAYSWENAFIKAIQDNAFSVNLINPKRVGTTELRSNDILYHYGMFIRLGGLASQGMGEYPVWRWEGHVLNADALCATDSQYYDAYIAKHLRGIWWEDQSPRPPKDSWSIQGNTFAYWTLLYRR